MRLASLCYTALTRSGLTTLARRLRRGGPILCYHNVVAEPAAAPRDGLGLHMPLPGFARQMRWLAANYDVISLDEFVRRASGDGSLCGAATVTFDDGYAGVFDHAWPLLRELRIPATVFIVAEGPGHDEGFWWDHPEALRDPSPARRHHWLTALRGDGATIVESLRPANSLLAISPSGSPARCRTADWQTITDAVRCGLQLGVHSATHRSLPELDDVDLRREVVESRDIIARSTGVTPQFFAYPYGLWDDRVRRAVRSAGYRAAFTLDQAHTAAMADLWALPRVNVPAGIEDAAFEAWTAGLNLRRHAS